MVDEFRHYPLVYENKAMVEWRRKNLSALNQLQRQGVTLKHHYTASTACAPSRASLYTGQCPSLHGVVSTDGAAKYAYDSDMSWLDPQSVPTLGHMFSHNDYNCYWIGKWHVSASPNITIPSTHDNVLTYDSKGLPDFEGIKQYLDTNRLQAWGFNSWIGPDPHGESPLNSGDSVKSARGRDPFYAEQCIAALTELAKQQVTDSGDTTQPWLVSCSFVNPHDIALFGQLTENPNSDFDFNIEPEDAVPEDVFNVLFDQTFTDDLRKKPIAQLSYRNNYNSWFPSLANKETAKMYFRVYYNLQRKVNREIQKVLDYLDESGLADNTIVLLTSDHGDLLGSHGYMHQKWYNMYEESIHVPCIVRWPGHIAAGSSYDGITSHLDVIPTLLGLSGIGVDSIYRQGWFFEDFLNSRRLVGTDLSAQLLDATRQSTDCSQTKRLSFFMTNDDITRGLGIHNFLLLAPTTVTQPTSVYAIIMRLEWPDKPRYNGIWKFASYVDAKSLWTNPAGVNSNNADDEQGGEADTSTVPFDDYVVNYKFTCIDGRKPLRATLCCHSSCNFCADNGSNSGSGTAIAGSKNNGKVTVAKAGTDISRSVAAATIAAAKQPQVVLTACVNRDVKIMPAKPQYEMYWLSNDPMELTNYAYLISQGKIVEGDTIFSIAEVLYDTLLAAFD